jgi:hypothetical protein
VVPPTLPWYADGLRTWIPLVSKPADPKVGLRYLAAFRGQLELKSAGLSAPRKLAVRTFKANTLAYSYLAKLSERATTQDATGKKSAKGKISWDYDLQWRGRAW